MIQKNTGNPEGDAELELTTGDVNSVPLSSEPDRVLSAATPPEPQNEPVLSGGTGDPDAIRCEPSEPRDLVLPPGPPTPSEECPEELSPDANRWGVLVREEIKSQKLIRVPDAQYDDERCYKHASYDFRLGAEYIIPNKGGKDSQLEISTCDANGILTIKRFASAIVSTYESVALPNNVAGRFDLRIRHALEGLMVQRGTQIEPGYDGQLFALIHNISEHDVSLKFRDYNSRPFTIEFCYTSKPTTPPPNKQKKLQDFVPPTVARGGIDRVLEELEKVSKQLDAKKTVFLTAGLLAILIAFVSFLVPFMLTKFTYDKNYFPIVSADAITKYGASRSSDAEIVAKVLRELETKGSGEYLYVERLAQLKARRDSLKGDPSRAQEVKSIEKEIDQILELLRK